MVSPRPRRCRRTRRAGAAGQRTPGRSGEKGVSQHRCLGLRSPRRLRVGDGLVRLGCQGRTVRWSRRQSEDIRAGRRRTGQASGDMPRSPRSPRSARSRLRRMRPWCPSWLGSGLGWRPTAPVPARSGMCAATTQYSTARWPTLWGKPLPPTPRTRQHRSAWAVGLLKVSRSQERELALFAAADVLGVLQATTAPNPRWGSVDVSDPSARARSRQARPRDG